MKKSNHILWTFGLSLWIFYFGFENLLISSIIYSFLTSAISSLPDVDIKIVKKIDEFNRNTFYLFSPITLIFRFIFRHRTITHSIWLALIFLILGELFLYGIFKIVLRILYLAIIFHIFEDAFTISGVRPFFPFSFKLRFFNFKTNSWFDTLFLLIVGWLFIGLFFVVIIV